jgi:DNA-binding MarR family transcriptional regulator
MTTIGKKRSDKTDYGHGLALSESIAPLMRGLARDCTKALESRLAAHNVSSGMWFPLRVLWEHDGILQHMLQKELGTAQPTLVTALDRLERRGLITRRRNKRDKRHVHVHLTKRGRELEVDIHHYADDVQALITKDVTGKELATLYAVIEKMKRALAGDRDLEHVVEKKSA